MAAFQVITEGESSRITVAERFGCRIWIEPRLGSLAPRLPVRHRSVHHVVLLGAQTGL